MSAWEKQSAETSKAYAAFCVYRDLGVERSIDSAYRKTTAKLPQNSRAPKFWFEWAAENDWKSRAEVYDADQDRKKREAVDQAQREEIERFRLQLRKDNEEFAKASRVSLQKALASLRKLSNEDLRPRDAANLLNAATLAIKTANEIQAQSLGLDELVQVLDNADSDNDNEPAGDTR